MRLNHLNLTVTDVRAAASFFETYFGLHDMGGNAGMTVLSDLPEYRGMILTLMKAKPSTFQGYPETFHVGFFTEDRAEVDALAARLRADGFEFDDPADTGHSYGFYVNAPGGVVVEVGA
jgi:lactoylglutathione lyase